MSAGRNKEPRILRQLLQERGVKDKQGIQELVKELTADLIQEALDAELEEELGYSKYDYKNKLTNKGGQPIFGYKVKAV